MSASLSATQEKMFEAARVPSHSGRNVFDNFTDDQSYSYEHGQPRSFSGVEFDRQTLLTSSSNTLPDPHMTVPVFKQRFAVDTHIDSDKRLPEIKGIVFTSKENFVVSDGRNQMLKAFSCSGAYLDFIADPGPMSVTFCNGWLMWNSQFSNIKFYNTKTAEVITNPSLSQTAPHPLTSCRNQTYLVGNVNKSSIEAYTVDVPGKLVLYMVPKDCDGRVINDVSAIATRNKNHLVVIDNFNKRVVINDLTGRFVGEFFKDDCEPSSVCITEHDQIFVTDIYRNKIILLNAHGRFIKEWGTLVERPSAIATNGQGTLAVGGAGRNVIIYEYRTN